MRDKDYIFGFIYSAFIAFVSVIDLFLILYFESENLIGMKIFFILIPITGCVFFKDKSLICFLYKQFVFYTSFTILLFVLLYAVIIFYSYFNIQNAVFINEFVLLFDKIADGSNNLSIIIKSYFIYFIDIVLFVVSNFVCTIVSLTITNTADKRIQKKHKKIYKKSISK